MTPAARLAAAIEVLDQVATARGPADEVLKAWGRAHRFAGSKDRRALAEHVYTALRARARSAWALGADTGRALVLGALRWSDGLDIAGIEALFTGEGHAPPPLSAVERAGLDRPLDDAPDWVRAGAPTWIVERLMDQFGAEEALAEIQAAILPRAPVDLRVNTLRGDVAGALRLLAHEDITPEPTPISTLGLRLPPAFARDVQSLRAYSSGWIEVQDEGSQIVAALSGAKPGERVVDYCAGGGGKTLALGAMIGGAPLVASDVNPKRLAAMAERLERAGVKADVRRLGPEGEGMDDLEGQADLVFVDAPCSGSGTWRRHPESAWRLTPETVARLSTLQGEILERAARLVRPGGRLVYVTCSLLAAENGAVADRFAETHPGFRPRPVAEAAATPLITADGRGRLAALASGGHTLQLTPRRTGTDGFFAALFERSP